MFKLKGVKARVLLEAWLAWVRRCRIPAFVKLASTISAHRAGIHAALTEGLSNGLVESVNTKLRLLTIERARTSDAPTLFDDDGAFGFAIKPKVRSRR